MITHVKEKRNKTPHIVKEYVTARDVSEPERWPDDQKKNAARNDENDTYTDDLDSLDYNTTEVNRGKEL